MSNEALQKALEGVDGYELNSAGNIDINRTVGDLSLIHIYVDLFYRNAFFYAVQLRGSYFKICGRY